MREIMSIHHCIGSGTSNLGQIAWNEGQGETNVRIGGIFYVDFKVESKNNAFMFKDIQSGNESLSKGLLVCFACCGA